MIFLHSPLTEKMPSLASETTLDIVAMYTVVWPVLVGLLPLLFEYSHTPPQQRLSISPVYTIITIFMTKWVSLPAGYWS